MSDLNEVIRERDHALSKISRLESRVRELEYANAELVVRDKQLTERLKEASGRQPYRPRSNYKKRA